jgi:hypothetical protein
MRPPSLLAFIILQIFIFQEKFRLCQSYLIDYFHLPPSCTINFTVIGSSSYKRKYLKKTLQTHFSELSSSSSLFPVVRSEYSSIVSSVDGGAGRRNRFQSQISSRYGTFCTLHLKLILDKISSSSGDSKERLLQLDIEEQTRGAGHDGGLNTFIFLTREKLPLITHAVYLPIRLFFITITQNLKINLYCPFCKEKMFRVKDPVIMKDLSTVSFMSLRSLWAPKITILVGQTARASSSSLNSKIKRLCPVIAWERKVPPVKKAKYCGLSNSIMETVMKKINVSIEYIPVGRKEDAYETTNNDNGYFGFTFPTSISRLVGGVQANVFDYTNTGKIVYCKYHSPSDEISIHVWVSPFRTGTWMAFLATSSAILAVISIKQPDKIMANLFFVIFTMVRQAASERHFLLEAFSLSMVVVASLYDNMITGNIIVPWEPKPMSNVAELVDAGYKIVYSARTGSPKKMLKRWQHPNEYYLKRGVHYNATKLFIGYENALNMKKEFAQNVFGKKEKKRAFYDTSARAKTSSHVLPRMTLYLPKFKCFKLAQDILPRFSFWRSVFALDKEITRSVGHLRENGLREFWSSFGDMYRQLANTVEERHLSKRARYRRNNIDNSYITAKNLLSLFCIQGILYLVALIAFAIEIFGFFGHLLIRRGRFYLNRKTNFLKLHG